MIAARLPSVAQAVEIIGMQLTKSSQASQLRYMAETQSKEFAQQVHDKAKAAGKLKGKE